MPNSPLVYFQLAQARVREQDWDLALSAAKRANELDVTNLQTYLLLGQIYAAQGNDEEAAKALGTYLKYNPDDGDYLLLGRLHFANQQFEERSSMNRLARLQPTAPRFLSNIELGRGEQAEQDVDTVMLFYRDLFEANLAVIRMHVLQERYGTALLQLDKTIALAETDEQKAQAYYWSANVYEAREEFDDAAEHWALLLELPEEAMTEEMRAQAEERLAHSPPQRLLARCDRAPPALRPEPLTS
jgi:tetratricopeptide (TPR) repeat protein